MPQSWNIYYDLYKEQIKSLAPKKILDVGPGIGTYGKLSREAIPNNLQIDAVESTTDYIQKFNLKSIYNTVHNKTIQDFLYESARMEYDVAVCGDVLEHLFLHEAISVIDCLLYRCDKVAIIWPTNLKQNSVNIDNKEVINDFENHKCNIHLSDLTRFNVLFYVKNKMPHEKDDVYYHYALVSK